ncbi:uncharacterized protein LOC120267898 [Dioscorea cayenensis subsp. rotundata]|uniref:Uncharacterized protein LOC120267898 n=1 Tax=Dioscorea cayennensis subsp. rotundata TaxID=55577 RepID=A0AB40BZ78_DIOCR|nr:uncharacterized protein LOC120267898 [Dioscorea cayenensis subsp. rotundata]
MQRNCDRGLVVTLFQMSFSKRHLQRRDRYLDLMDQASQTQEESNKSSILDKGNILLQVYGVGSQASIFIPSYRKAHLQEHHPRSYKLRLHSCVRLLISYKIKTKSIRRVCTR